MLNHRQIEAFRAAVRLGSASAAAEALHVTQPAVSRLIADFERAVGFALFERRQRGLHPTTDGLLLFEEVERSFRGLDLIETAAEGIRSHRSGRVRVVAMPVYVDGLVAEVIGGFLYRAPEVDLELEVADQKEAQARVLSEQFDLGILSTHYVEAGLDAVPLARHQATVVCPPDHPLAKRERARCQDLADEPFLALPLGSPFRAAIDRHVAAQGVELSIRAEARTQSTLCALAAAGAGVSIVDPAVVTPGATLAALRLEPPIEWAVIAIMPARVTPSQATKALLRDLTAAFAESNP